MCCFGGNMIAKVVLLILGLVFEAMLAVADIGGLIAALVFSVVWVLRWLAGIN